MMRQGGTAAEKKQAKRAKAETTDDRVVVLEFGSICQHCCAHGEQKGDEFPIRDEVFVFFGGGWCFQRFHP